MEHTCCLTANQEQATDFPASSAAAIVRQRIGEGSAAGIAHRTGDEGSAAGMARRRAATFEYEQIPL